MGSLPGGGAEILVDRVREAMTVNKCLTEEWLEVHRVWHQLGGKSTCTMMFGHIETLAERIETLDRLRRLQDETGGFTAFICWTFQPENTAMAHVATVGAFEYLRTQAIARLYLDNIPNIQSSWVTQGPKIGQLALFFGANDMGSLMIEENVVASAGHGPLPDPGADQEQHPRGRLHPPAAERLLSADRSGSAIASARAGTNFGRGRKDAVEPGGERVSVALLHRPGSQIAHFWVRVAHP